MQLDNPIWSALTSGHTSLAQGNGLARRYPQAVSPLAGLAEPSPEAFAALHALSGPGDRFGLFTTAPLTVPASDWTVVNERWIEQMVCEEPATEASSDGIVELGAEDVPAMLALTAATQPGPFGERTYEMGRYIGIRD